MGENLSMSEQTATGGCLCGQVRYVAEGRRLWAAYCHCATCRRHVAGPVAVFVGYPNAQARFTGAEPAIYRSSPDVERGFCAACGTPVFYRSAQRHPGEIHLLIGTLDRPDAIAPQIHVFVEERLPWFETTDHLPRYAGSSTGADPISRGPDTA